MSEKEDLKKAHVLAKVYFDLFQQEEIIKKKIALKKSISPFMATFGYNAICLCISFILYLVVAFGFTTMMDRIELGRNSEIILGVAFLFVMFSYPLIVIFWGNIMVRVQIRQSKKKKQAIEKNLLELSLTYPETYNILQQSYEVAFEDATAENFVPLFYTDFLCKFLIKDEDQLLIENVKRIAFNIANTKFILESLSLQDIIANNLLQTNLYAVLDGFQFLHTQQIADADNPKLLEVLEQVTNSIIYVEGIIQTLNKVVNDKKLVARIDSNTQKMRELIKDQPVARTNVKSIRTPSGFDRDQFLSTLSALDEEVVEIRTRAGTFYASLSNIHQKDKSKNREIGLSTDKELELKLEVLNNTLDMLEQEKNNLSDEEYKKIKSEHLAQLSAAKKALHKRRGISKQIICPYCQNSNSPISDTCKECKNELPYCIVCLNSIGVGEKVSICPHCKSYAHAKHFKDWLDETKTCPYCKRKIRKQLNETVLELMVKENIKN
ncbi:MAG: hypothetical protein FK733_15870 [Asgard group archaeon]|nr:hypothetical protein [Asgard group archaeon]